MAQIREVSVEVALARLMHQPASNDQKSQPEVEVITIKVGTGEDARHFGVHKDRLCARSEIFRDYLASNPSVTEIDRPDEDPYIFSLVIQYLYRGTLPDVIPPPPFIITVEQKIQLLNFLSRVRNSQYGKPFQRPVRELWPEIAEAYAEKVDKPIDLLTIEMNVWGDWYNNLGELKPHFDRWYNNSVTFNDLNHPISNCAHNLRRRMFAFIDTLEKQAERDATGSTFTRSMKKSTGPSEEEEEEDARSREGRHNLQRLICVSERYRLDSLTAICMDALTKLYKTHHLSPSAPSILYIYSQTSVGSKLRLYVSRSLAHAIMNKSPNDGGIGGVETDWIWDVMKENNELSLDVLAELRGKNGMKVAEAEDACPCEYHWHGEGDICTAELY